LSDEALSVGVRRNTSIPALSATSFATSASSDLYAGGAQGTYAADG